jgi:hypothetical protein
VQIETKLALATIVSRFKVAVDEAKMACKTVEELGDSCTFWFTLRPAGGVHLKLTPRAAAC